MADPTKQRAYFQIHLSTAIVLMFVAGVLIWLNVQKWPNRWKNDGFEFNICPTYGWPLYTRYRIMTLDSEEASLEPVNGYIHWPHVFIDAIIAIGILVLVAFICEKWLIRRRSEFV